MKDPDRLPHVLLALLAHPGRQHLLSSPVALVNYLRKAWPEAPEDSLWAASLSPDSQAAAEEAEMLPQLEARLAELDLSPVQQAQLLRGLAAVCPEAEDNARLLLSAVPVPQ